MIGSLGPQTMLALSQNKRDWRLSSTWQSIVVSSHARSAGENRSRLRAVEFA